MNIGKEGRWTSNVFECLFLSLLPLVVPHRNCEMWFQFILMTFISFAGPKVAVVKFVLR